MSGAECAVDANPLSQVMKHTEGDRSLQQDRLSGPSSSRLHYLPGTAAGPSAERDIQMARQFFDGPAQQGPMFAPPPPQQQLHMGAPTPFQELFNADPAALASVPSNDYLTYTRRKMPDGSSTYIRHPPGVDHLNWAAEFQPTAMPNSAPLQNMTPAPQQNFSQNQFMNPSLFGMGGMSSMPMYGHNMGMGTLSNPMMAAPTLDKGKGKLRAEDFENAFAQAENMHQAESSKIEEVTDEDRFTGLEDAMRDASMDEKQKEEPSTTAQLPSQARSGSDFSEVWDQLQKSQVPPPQEDMQKWEVEFNQMMSSQREDDGLDYDDVMKSAWETQNNEYESSERIIFTDDGIPVLGAYVFEKENRYLAQNAQSLLSEAKALLNQNGSLSEAALLLEAAIQKGELGEGGYEAWILLGETRNMDEREEAGIKALNEGVRIAHEAGAGGAGMLALAISYTNESYERAAHTMLLRWLSAAYPSAEISEAAWASINQSSWHSHEEVTKVFMDLARAQHSKGIVDPDVQAGLGVLFYTSSDFDRAKDCFEAALSVKPTDYQLWNRLGSSLSNGSKHEESLGAYREALNLRPTYVRAISNVAVACLNIGAYQEAAEHLLSALSMQVATAGQTSEQLWFTLRRVFLEMNRPDLAELTKENRNLDAYRSQGFEF